MTPAEMNRLIALRVMGWHEWDGEDDYDGPLPMFCKWVDSTLSLYEFEDDTSYFDPSPTSYFAPSHDERDCHRALTKMREKGWNVVVEGAAGVVGNGAWCVELSREDIIQARGWADTFCAAACEAMRLATEADDEQDS